MIAALIAVPIYMLFLRGDGGSASSDLVKAATDPAAAARVLIQQVGDPTKGVTLRYPEGWSGEVKGGFVRARSGDKNTVVSVINQGPASSARTIFKDAVQGISSSYKNGKVSFLAPSRVKPISGLQTAEAVVTGRLKSGADANTLVAVARGHRRAYLVSVIAPANGGELGTASLIVARGLTLSD